MTRIRQRIETIERRSSRFRPAVPGTPLERMSEEQLIHVMTGGRRTALTESEYRELEGLLRDTAGTLDTEALAQWTAGLA